MNDLTLMLQAVEHGEKVASEDLLPLVYGELRRLAARGCCGRAPGSESYFKGCKNGNGTVKDLVSGLTSLRETLINSPSF